MGLYAVMLALTWDSIEAHGLPIGIAVDPKLGRRFIPVFDSREEAEKAYPGAEILMLAIRPTTSEEGK